MSSSSGNSSVMVSKILRDVAANAVQRHTTPEIIKFIAEQHLEVLAGIEKLIVRFYIVNNNSH
jgi:hypothetical protein